ncbi:MAG: sulfonate transport system substrate-binding protein [Chloroflexota bacterium]|nr:sulfonate transport system substrate-binding protein [Chloroflexota bacterium]
MKKSIILVVLAAILLSACSSTAAASAAAEGPVPTTTLRVAQQFGLGYAALTIADELNLFEKYLPGLQVEWLQLGSGGAINEAFIAGEIDVAVMGIPPFLIGWDKGIPWKVASGMCIMPLSLQTYKQDVNSLADFGPDDKIAYPAPGSIQHILLSMAAERQLGSPTALDDIGVAMAHPDAAAALMNQKDITGHFTSPPYNFEELSQDGIKTVVDGTQAFGSEFTFLVAVASNDLYENNPQAYAAFVLGIAEAADYINQNPEAAAKILAPSFGLDEETTLKYLTWPGMDYVTTPLGLMGFSDFMQNAGYIEKVPQAVSDIAFPNVVAAIGQQSGTPSDLETLQYRPE